MANNPKKTTCRILSIATSPKTAICAGNLQGRWRKFTYEEIIARDKTGLDRRFAPRLLAGRLGMR